MNFSARLRYRLFWRPIRRSAATGLVVAVSGGADSACLLTALVQPGVPPFRNLPGARRARRSRPATCGCRLAAPCEELCRRLRVPLSIVPVMVDSTGGVSIEAAARDARYAGARASARPGECLLTAHHAAGPGRDAAVAAAARRRPQGPVRDADLPAVARPAGICVRCSPSRSAICVHLAQRSGVTACPIR
jgi:hypothetical protein